MVGDHGSAGDAGDQCKDVALDRGVIRLCLDLETWIGLEEIAAREGMSLDQICRVVDKDRGNRDLADAIQSFALLYFFQATANQAQAPGGESGDFAMPAPPQAGASDPAAPFAGLEAFPSPTLLKALDAVKGRRRD